MMSPDPPRSNENSIPEEVRHLEFVQDDDDDIFGVGEHVLDYSDQSESWSSEDEPDYSNTHVVTGVHNMEDEIDEAGNVRFRTQYRMLVPFEIEEEGEVSSDIGNSGRVDDSEELSYQFEALSTEAADINNSTQRDQREIPLTDESVEKIKEVMQSFKLPESAIPNWAKDINEDIWKRKLVNTLETKSREPSTNS